MGRTAASTAALACPPNDKDCLNKLSTNKLGGGGLQNNEFELRMISSETLVVPDGLLSSLRLVLHNPTSKDLVNFDVPVSLASVLQGDPLQPAPVLKVRVELLRAGETTLHFVNGLVFPPLEGGRFWCLDPQAPSSTG